MATNERDERTRSGANQDRDDNVGRGRDDLGDQAAPPTAGRAAAPSTDAALGLAGAPDGLRDGPTNAAGIETGNATLGSSANEAERMDRFNGPRP